MIPRLNIVAWSAKAPWPELRQVEQDLIISRALVALFSDPVLKTELRFRGGTALNKILFPEPLRYSEDIDLVRTKAEGIGPMIGRIRGVLEPWLGPASFDQSAVAPKLRFRVDAEDGPAPLKLKVEIATREREAFDPPRTVPFAVENPWFTGQAEIATYSREELLATKLRALLQRDKGRDLLDLAHALAIFPDLDKARVVECLGLYLERGGQSIGRAEAEMRMFAKLARPTLAADIRPLLRAEVADRLSEQSIRQSFVTIFRDLVAILPGPQWAKTAERLERLGLSPNNGACPDKS
jgi:predicted nucleotidyltransferase component of viral defense system